MPTMRAAVYHGPGDVRIEGVPRPADPGPGELIVRVRRAAICGTDAAEFAHGPKLVPMDAPHPHSGRVGPLVLGHEFAGEVVATGAGVEGVAVGDRVVSGAGVSCGTCARCREGRTNLCDSYYTIGLHADGGLAEYVVVPARICCRIPDGCPDDAATLSQPLAVGLHALRRGRLAANETLAVIGVGGIGAMVVAGARAQGVQTIVAVDLDPRRLEAATALGATAVVAAGDGALERLLGIVDGFDLVVEATGVPTSPALAVAAARRGGRVVVVGLQPRPVEIDLFTVAMDEIELIGALAHVFADDLPQALDILATTDTAQRCIDRVIGLTDLVDQGLVPLAHGRVGGKVVIDPSR